MKHLRRKVLAAIISSLLFAIIFSFIGGFDRNGFYNLLYLNMTIALTYGIIGSFLSDWLCKKFSEKESIQQITTFLLHCGFGVLFQFLGLCSAILFYLIDRALKKYNIGWLPVTITFAVAVGCFTYLLMQ